MSPAIYIRQATLSYHQHVLFSALNLDVPAQQWVALLGPSGVGKSSLLRMIAGLNTAHDSIQGTIDADNAIPVSKQIAYMAQTDLLLPWFNALDNATLGLKLRSFSSKNHAQQIQKAHALLDEVGLSKAKHLYPHQLSGGMRQRVALVRTLMEDKPIVLMDEPFYALDAITRYKLQALAYGLLKNKTVFFITHDPAEALRLANIIYIMQGQPATLKEVARLNSAAPRDFNDPEVTQLQTLLFHELTKAAHDDI
jgi:putative hydroxymethylpyrimidine transport system ATP-binding protein